jgi:chromosome segregation ATPase
MDAKSSEPSLERLRAALDSLETAVERRSRVDARRADADEELAIMQDDRARLAVELDGALASARALASANAAASERVAHARATIEAMLRRAGE